MKCLTLNVKILFQFYPKLHLFLKARDKHEFYNKISGTSYFVNQ